MDKSHTENLIVCTDINGGVHLVCIEDLVDRSSVYAVISVEDRVVMVLDRSAVSLWSFPGGGIELGETRAQALHREVFEETNLILEADIQEIVTTTEFFYDLESDTSWRSTRTFFRARARGTLELGGNDDDIVGAKLLAIPSDLDKIAPTARAILDRVGDL
jgi:8-oxo-dGTP pyrophosphatase MutT (NUDIX family)